MNKTASHFIMASLLMLVSSIGYSAWDKTKKSDIDKNVIVGSWKGGWGVNDNWQMIFEPSGKLIFKNQFENYNPAGWSYEKETAELYITLPDLNKDAMVIINECIKKGDVKSFDSNKKQISYSVDSQNPSINFLGYEFHKNEK